MHDNLAALMVDRKSKWETIIYVDNYYMVAVNAIPYPSCGVVMNIVSNKDITYRIAIGNTPQIRCPHIMKMYS